MPKLNDPRMCDSPMAQSTSDQSESISTSSHHKGIFRDRGARSGVMNRREETTSSYHYRFQLEKDIKRLEYQLRGELELHVILKNATGKNAVKVSNPSRLSNHVTELLGSIAFLEATVSELEQEMVSLQFKLSQERNEQKLVEYRLRRSSTSNTANSDIFGPMRVTDAKPCQLLDPMKLQKAMSSKSFSNHPNLLSEEMVRCMKNIFISLGDSSLSKTSSIDNHSSAASPRGHLSSSSWWSSSERSMMSSWIQSPQIDIKSNSELLASENAFDPYRVRGKLSWTDIGNYGLVTEVSWMSVGKQQLEYASEALRRFRALVEQLAKVNPIHLSCSEKLAFWINLYNALIMHAYLAYGVPRSDLKLFSLMQKAAYTVGGCSFSATAIEYAILKMKPPVHRPQTGLLLAVHKLKLSNEQREAAIERHEPLVAFALSCGLYSSPAVRIYTAVNVREELQEAQRDFVRASVGVSSKGKLLVPKLLHCFAKSYVDDLKLAIWITHYLPPHQAAFVEECISKRRQTLLGSGNFGILPFDSRFRYLFLPDKISL